MMMMEMARCGSCICRRDRRLHQNQDKDFSCLVALEAIETSVNDVIGWYFVRGENRNKALVQISRQSFMLHELFVLLEILTR